METRIPSLRGLEAFVNAAETLSFRVAAERMNMTVSAISHRIHVLEEEVGLQLFDRSGSKVRLTQAGTIYGEFVRPLLQDLRRATETVRAQTDGSVLRIASFQLFEAHWLVPRVNDFLETFPEVDLELVTLRRRQSTHPDLTIRIIRDAEVGSEDELLFKLDSTPICRPELVESLSLREPKDILRARLIKMSTALRAWPAWFKAANVEADMSQSSIVVDSPTLSHDLVMAGAGVGLTSSIFAAHMDKLGLVKPFDLQCSWFGDVYINRADAFERPIVRAFRTWMRDALRS